MLVEETDEKKDDGKTETSLTAVKTGNGFAAWSGDGKKVAISCDEETDSTMLKYALTAGLMEGGAQVVDFGKQTLPVTRAAIRFYGLAGGIHVMKTAEGRLRFRMMDETGADLRREAEESVETEGQQSVKIQGAKGVLTLHSYRSYYVRDVVNRLRNTKLRYNLLLYAANAAVRSMVTSVLNEVSCNYKLSGNAGGGKNDAIETLRRGMRNGKFDFGAYLDESGERLVLVNREGRVIPDAEFYLLTAYICMKSHTGTAYVAAPSCSYRTENLAKTLAGHVVRTTVSPLEQMVRATGGESVCEQFVLEYDAVGGLVKLLDFLQEEGTTLQDVLQRLPQTYFSGKECFCEEQTQRALMQHWMRRGGKRAVALDNGVKLYEKTGWVVVEMQRHRPKLRIISEGVNMECAEELAVQYQKEVQHWGK